MAASEADRLDLYNGLSEVLGPTRAETLMTYLPAFDPSELVTHTDFSSIREDISSVREDISALRADIHELRSDLNTGLAAVNARIDRLFLTLVAGLFVVVAAMTGVVFAAL